MQVLTFVAIFATLCNLPGNLASTLNTQIVLRSTDIEQDYASQLSPAASVNFNASSEIGSLRWSEYNTPKPGAIVNVATEKDVALTVQYLTRKRIPFFTSNGGHGWSSSININNDGVVINMRGLNKITFNTERTQAIVGGGAIVKEVIDAAYAAHTRLLTGNCNCVGTLGAGLGGGYGNLLGLYGFSVDNILSMNVVLANGSLVTVTSRSDPDLFWAMRGAGPNFGIVTSAVYKAYPTPASENLAWVGGLSFEDSKLEQVVNAIQRLKLEPKMNIFMYLINGDPNGFKPTVFVTPFFLGTEAQGRAAFKSILDIGPFNDTTSVLPYNKWNSGADNFCVKGQRKPSFGTGIGQLDPKTWRDVFEELKILLRKPGTGFSSIVVECYSLETAQRIPSSSASFPGRDIRFNSVYLPWYADSHLDNTALSIGNKIRDLWRSTDTFKSNRTYVNFAHGDESNEVVYQGNAARLLSLKKRYDPKNIFSHWFDIKLSE